MAKELYPAGRNVRLLLDSAVIIIGFIMFGGLLALPQTNFWLPWTLALAGVFISSIPSAYTRLLGLIVSVIGVYLILRYAGIFSAPLLAYGLGMFLIIAGAVNLVRDARGGSVPKK